MKHKIIEEIKKEFFLIDALQKEAQFECYSDGVATYHLYDECGGFHELCIINENVTFFNKEKVCELLDFENSFYISHRYFAKLDPISKKTFEQLGETKTFRLVDTDEWEKQNKAKEQN